MSCHFFYFWNSKRRHIQFWRFLLSCLSSFWRCSFRRCLFLRIYRLWILSSFFCVFSFFSDFVLLPLLPCLILKCLLLLFSLLLEQFLYLLLGSCLMHFEQPNSLQFHRIKKSFLMIRLFFSNRNILFIVLSEELRDLIQLVKAFSQFLIEFNVMNSLLHLNHFSIQHLLLLRH